jgi:Raf kinase inhibitor-like YbhB/YbcL family protein
MDLRRAWFLGGFVFLWSKFAGLAQAVAPVSISAPAFAQGQPIPDLYAYAKENISPELRIAKVPANAKSLVLIVDDPDAPSGLWTHWLVWNLSPKTTTVPEGKLPVGVVEGKNSFGHSHYDGPAPPSGTHRYFFHVYALDTILTLSAGSERTALQASMNGHVLGQGETFGTYSASP